VLNRFRIFPSTSAVTLRPRIACEITVEGVVAARQETALDSAAITAFTPLPLGTLTPGLVSPNIVDRPAVVAALRQVLDEVAARTRQVSLVIPDHAARVLLLEFDTLPSKLADALPIIRFRLRKLVPFEVDDAAIGYQVIHQDAEQVRTVVAVTPSSVLAEYESAVREAGYLPGAVLPSTLATLAVVPETDNALVINCSGSFVTSAITRRNELLLYRTIELPKTHRERIVELQQVVTVAMAYFEDNMAAPPEALLYVGPGGAAELTRVLAEDTAEGNGVPELAAVTPVAGSEPVGDGGILPAVAATGVAAITVRDLVPTPETGAVTAMPPGMLAGVVGALAN
jgi:type IV pilus assembly protein PilM